jgi:hypothetical protein
MDPVTMAAIAAALGLVVFAKSKSSSASAPAAGSGSSTTPVTTSNGGTVYPYVTPGAPNFPATYNQSYYETYIRPNMIKADPNILNANYVLTRDEAAQYLANYDGVNTWANLPATINSAQVAAMGQGATVYGACIYHWKQSGIPDKRTFLWLYPPDTSAYVAPPGKSSSGSLFSSILKDVGEVAGAAIAIAGPNDSQLNPYDIELIVTGSAIVKNSIGLFANADPTLVSLIDNRLDQVLTSIS